MLRTTRTALMLRTTLPALALLAACSKPMEPPPAPEVWKPGKVYRTERSATARGWLDRRGLIHAHSYYSHDACDGKPITDAGTYDESCLDDFRDGLCKSGHDFTFLTDHQESFVDNDFPAVLLYRQGAGDTLVDHGAGPTANRLACPGTGSTDRPLLMAGNETEMMPIGLERHADGRGAAYSDVSDAGIEKVHAAGGLTIMAHPEGHTVDELAGQPLDGFEMYNLHANSLKNLAIAADWALKSDAKMFDGLPDPNIFLIGYVLEDDVYLERWGSTLARGVQRTTTMGTDCHRNTLPPLAADGERIDSYRRMMSMFSNHLLVRPKSDGTYDDRDLKDAIKAGRLYGSFDFLGYPVGFDFTATNVDATIEMGGRAILGDTLTVRRPTVQNLDTTAEAPKLTLRILRAKAGGWDEVASTSTEAELSYRASEAGAYRAEVRMTPLHLKAYGGKRQDLIRTDRPWVYSNAIYVK